MAKRVNTKSGARPSAKPGRFIRGNKTQITLPITLGLLERVDTVARRKEISRAALLTLWIGDALAKEERPT
jgi:hypothetical protein